MDALVSAMSGVSGAWVLDRHSDADHNRTVITIAGDPDSVASAALSGVGKAAELIDLTRHSGVHPRIGATDVLPFVPVAGVSLAECVTLARQVGNEIWSRYAIPVYFYEAAATRPERVDLANVRRGQFEGLQADVRTDPERQPDVGDARLHATAGAVAVGARKFLIAYNIHLDTPDVAVARQIARTVRYSNGGLPHVKAMGVWLPGRGQGGEAQVSMNLTDFEQTPLPVVFAAVRREAERYGCAITSSEIVGLVPAAALEMPAGADPAAELRLERFSPDQILENRLAAALAAEPAERIYIRSTT